MTTTHHSTLITNFTIALESISTADFLFTNLTPANLTLKAHEPAISSFIALSSNFDTKL